MAEPFKNFLSAAVVDEAARHLARAWPDFDAVRFRALALDGLDGLELKARAMQVAAALEATLPRDFASAADLIEAALAPVADPADPAVPSRSDLGLAGWIVWPVGEFVARRGLDAPERALACLHAITQRLTAEFALRPFIVRHPALVFATLRRWTTDPSAHVRRLVSEGSRPRLPWGLQLKALIDDPSPTLPLLEALQDDPSEAVRRSVANHLNDIAKDHPVLVAQWVERHLPGASRQRAALLEHACCTLIKRGDMRVLKAFGLDRTLQGRATLRLEPRRIHLGEAVRIEVRLASAAHSAQRLVVDYAVHRVKANGATRPKVFKGWTVDLAPGEGRALARSHAIRPITTRTYHAGRHEVDLRVNGRVVAAATFDLVLEPRARPSAANRPSARTAAAKQPPTKTAARGRRLSRQGP
jgi:3-methyladenine DNA glycosylase AlkC